MLWSDLHREALAQLSGRVPSPEAEARWIVEEASGYEAGEFVAGLRTEVTERGVVRFDRMLNRRLAGEPLQYVLGRWSFRRLDLFVDRRVLIPRPETEVVAGLALEELRRFVGAPTVAVDLGTGSGAIGLSLAVESTTTEVWLTDRSAPALAVAQANLAGIGIPGRRVSIVEGSWFEALPPELRGSVHVLVSNPPYVAESDELPSEVVDWEPPLALTPGPTGLEAIEEIVAGAVDWLAPAGSLVVEHAPDQAAVVVTMALQRGFGSAFTRADLTGRPRALVARR